MHAAPSGALVKHAASGEFVTRTGSGTAPAGAFVTHAAAGAAPSGAS